MFYDVPSFEGIGIYKIENTSNGKIYIGKSTNISSRIKSHLSQLQSNKHKNISLQNDFNKGHSFKVSLIETFNIDYDSRKLSSIEFIYISIYQSTKPEIGYNSIKTPYIFEKDEALEMLNKKKIRDIEDKFNDKQLIKQTRDIANSLGYELKIDFVKK